MNNANTANRELREHALARRSISAFAEAEREAHN
jgi:hypothetical protein